MSTKVQVALQSVRQLRNILPRLSEGELYQCLKWESETLRRKFIFSILINRLADLNRQNFVKRLKETINAPCKVRSNEQV